MHLVCGWLVGGRWPVFGWSVGRWSVVGGRLVGGFKETLFFPMFQAHIAMLALGKSRIV